MAAFLKGASTLPAITGLILLPPIHAQVDPQSRSILFIRGADGSGGATEGGTRQQRTEQLSDIYNTSTSFKNHGYDTLRSKLVQDGFKVAQLIESVVPITLAQLQQHRIVVFGSNNKVYSSVEVKAFHDYTDRGGSALFISDANWGLTWEAAAASDNQFLARYGAQVYQDSGQVPNMARSTAGRYLLPSHPVLSGPDGAGQASDVNNYNGEGVSLFRITTGSGGYQAVPVVSATGLWRRLNNPSGRAGTLQSAGPRDAAMISIERGSSRIVGHFDRNTFFNPNGAGTDITKLDNGQLALNIFRYLASVKASTRPVGKGCGRITSPILVVAVPVLGRSQGYTLSGASAKAPGWLVIAVGAPKPVSFAGGCVTQVDLALAIPAAVFATDARGAWSQQFPLPESHAFSGLQATAQTLTFVQNGPFLGGGELSNGSDLLAGYPR